MSGNSIINVSSWNVRGLNKIAKIKQVLGRIKQMKTTVCFLQETHLLDKDLNRIRSRWPGQVFFSNFTSHSRGVMILVHKSLPFILREKYLDPSGRFIILNGTIISTLVNLVCLCAPNGDDPAFYQHFFLTMASYNGQYIIGGDFNCVINPTVDRSNSSDTSHQQTRKTIVKFMKDLNLVEIWRQLHPDMAAFSCFSSTYKTYSHIDFFLVSSSLTSMVQDCCYESILLSDHAPINLSIKIFFSNPPSFRFQAKWLKSIEFAEFIEGKITDWFVLKEK